MSSNKKAVARKIRSEYMKKFRDPKWDTFSKNYEDSVKYRVTRRVMEQTHKPLFWDGWDSGSDSSGRSSPKLRESLEPLLAKLQTPLESRSENEEAQEVVEPAVNGQSTAPLSMENSSGVGKSASIAYSLIIIISPISLLLNIICSGLTGDNACQLFLIYLLSVHDDVHVVFWQRMVYQMRWTIRTLHRRLPLVDGPEGALPAPNPVTMATPTSPGHPRHPNHLERRASPQSGRNAVRENTGAPTCAPVGQRDTWRPGGEHQACEHRCLQGRWVMISAVNQPVSTH